MRALTFTRANWMRFINVKLHGNSLVLITIEWKMNLKKKNSLKERIFSWSCVNYISRCFLRICLINLLASILIARRNLIIEANTRKQFTFLTLENENIKTISKSLSIFMNVSLIDLPISFSFVCASTVAPASVGRLLLRRNTN